MYWISDGITNVWLRWAGYDPSEHKAIIEEYQKVEEAKKQLRAEKLNSKDEEEEEEEQDSDADEDKYVDEVDMPGTKVDSKQRITVRNLRIREDTAKYLRNLDPNSAYYDPKTRSMRDNPYEGTDREWVSIYWTQVSWVSVYLISNMFINQFPILQSWL